MASVFRRCAAFLARHAEWWCIPLVFTLAVIWIYRDLWHQGGVATGLGWDTIDTHGPDLDFFARELREGRFSLWNPYDKGGYPVFCDPVFDRYYPFSWPFAIWGAVVGSSWWLVQIFVLAHHVAAASCMHLFLRTRGVSVRGSLVGGLALIASAPLLVHKASNVLWPLVWVPLAWIAIDAALARPSWRRGVGVASAFALCATAGSPPGLFYATLLIAPYGMWRTIIALRSGPRDRAAWLQLAACVGAAAAVAGLVLAVTVVPTQQLVALGSRARVSAGRDFALALSLPLPAAARGVFVRGAGLFEMYLGCAVVLLAACAVAVRPRFDRGAAIVMVSVGVIGVVLAAGATGGVLPFLVDHVPGFALLRVPGRYKLLAAWTFAAAAGYGVAALEVAWGDVALRRRAIACAASAVVVSIVVVAGWAMPASPKDREAWWSIVAVVVAAGLVAVAVRAPARWSMLGFGALAMMVVLDAPAFTFVSPGAMPAAEPRQVHVRDDELVARLDGVRDRWRLYDEFVLGERAGARLRVRDFRGYPAVDPVSLRRYVDVLEYAKHDPAIVTDFNVRWVLKRPHFRYGDDTSFVRLPNPAFVDRGGGVAEAVAPAPLVAWYGAATIVDRARDTLGAMRAAQDQDGTRRHVVLERADLATLPPDAADRLASGPPASGEGAITSYEPDEIRFEVDAPSDGVVVLDEILFPGWEVDVDGAAAVPVRANYLLRAVWVARGHHAVTWRFSPEHWRVLVGGYLLALAIMIAAAATRRRRPA